MDQADARDQVNEHVHATLTSLERHIAAATDATNDLLEPLTKVASKGKRMRATLLLAAHDACNGTSPGAAVRVAAALELFQTAALIHDDVLDRSDTRRGLPSVHRMIEATHRTHGLDGDAQRHGINGAILTGDLSVMACLGEVASACAQLEPAVGLRVAQRFTAMASLCTAGQYLDVRLAATDLTAALADIDTIIAVMRSKTASYTTEGPLALGAAIAGCDDATVDAWAAAGVPLGIAFQLRDDILGITGAHDVTGKPAGDDLREGKRTIVLAQALARATATQRATILAVAGNTQATDDAVRCACDAVANSGAIDVVEQLITDYSDQARAALEPLVATGAHTAALNAFIDAAVRRDY